MSRRKRQNANREYKYDITVNDWHIDIEFNEYAYINIFELDQFEERIKLIMDGRIASTSSKKCKKNMAAKIIVHHSDIWYEKSRLREDLSAIGDMEVITAKSGIEDEDTLYFRISVPTKSYENMKDYLIFKGTAFVSLVGTELFRRKGEIFYLGFKKHSDLNKMVGIN